MFSIVPSGAFSGINSYIMQVEIDVADGLPSFNMVGLPSAEVREAGDRVRVAIRNSGIRIPPKHITVNFSPADIRKEGVSFDLPVAVGILTAMGEIDEAAIKETVILGELGLDGDVKPVRGVLPIVSKAREEGYKTCIVPVQNAREGAVVSGMKIIGVKSLQELLIYINTVISDRDRMISPTTINVAELFDNPRAGKTSSDFADIIGQSAVKRAAEISAAGFHNILMIGSPGSGKSMIARRIPSIMPPLTIEESLEVSTIYSVAGMLPENEALITARPFLSPHHSITGPALLGGGRIPQPGIISLAHRGVLFLDELAEFKRSTLDILRQPLEEHTVNISRNTGTVCYPSDFMLVAATNPCPCGFYPDRNKCNCTENAIARYLGHISGPVLDRIDICIEAPRIDVAELNSGNNLCESSRSIRKRVIAARSIQQKRFSGTGLRFNSDMDPNEIKRYCILGIREKSLLEQIFHRLNLSARSYHRLIKVARTIADLDGSERIRDIHINEAACYRIDDSVYWKRGSNIG